MKALVTGGTGFTGNHLAKKLSSLGHNVRILARNTSIVDNIDLPAVELFRGDLTQRDKVFAAVEGMDKVFHIAAAYRQANLTGKDFWDTNYQGTRNIIDACVEHGTKRLIHCSTIGIVSSVKNPPADETTEVSPGDTYQDSKCAAEFDVINLSKEKGLAATVIRPCAIYGPGDWRLLKIFKMIAKKRFLFFGNGKAYYHMVYIDDLVDAFLLASEKPEAVGEVFIIGGEKYITLNELAEYIAAEFNVPVPKLHLPYLPFEAAAVVLEAAYKFLKIKKAPFIYKRRIAFFKKSRAFSIEKAKRLLGYEPKVDLKTGIHLTAKWYIDKGLIDIGD